MSTNAIIWKDQSPISGSLNTLIMAFATRSLITLNGQHVLISSLEHEDGSGYCFNVKGIANGKPYAAFIRVAR